ncbi:hypothetical protein [Clostridium botulinum]|uniref:hypothetical protein n=1 Tax=Clostridium botulinum TaxID=1491 RepID=UPI00138F3860|nr:hypothetical protein [Clostridium botulinum]MBY6879491.1 hypothetical protein [Clostridium botulinum]
MESLPQYKDVIQKKEKKHLTVKIIAVFMFAIILAVVAYFSGAKSFSKAYIHVFTLFSVVNIYDMIVLDIGLFCHSKKTRIPGTEDMDKEYRSPWYWNYNRRCSSIIIWRNGSFHINNIVFKQGTQISDLV